jgi:predicted Fe-Mo cluster-binding NifX family protein
MEKQTQRVAVTICNGRISPVFEVARRLLLLEVEDGRVIGRREEPLECADPGQQTSRLSYFQPNVLICGAIQRPQFNLLTACGIRVVPFVAGEAEAVITAHLDGSLTGAAWSMPGCCGRNGFGPMAGRAGRGCGRSGRGQGKKCTSAELRKGITKMKLIVTSVGKDVTDLVDMRFGRAPYFLLVDMETGAVTVHENSQNLNAAQGAGIQSAETAVRLGADAVISGNVGPKAFRALAAAGVKIYQVSGNTAADAVERFKKGDLKETKESTVEGHWV